MIKPITQEEIVTHWAVLEETLNQQWHVGINYETLPNLKRRLLAQECYLWAWSNEEYRAQLLFVTEVRNTATAKMMVVTHTAGIKGGSWKYTKSDFVGMIGKLFEEIEDLALTLYFDAVCIHARPAHVKIAKDYKKMCQPIVKQLTNKRGT